MLRFAPGHSFAYVAVVSSMTGWGVRLGEKEDPVELFHRAYSWSTPVSVQWRMAEPVAESPLLAGQVDAGGYAILMDPDGPLRVRREGETVYDPRVPAVMFQWRVILDGSGRVGVPDDYAAPYTVEVFEPRRYTRMGRTRGEPAQVITSDALSTDLVESERERKQMTPMELASTRDYIGMIAHARTFLADASDLAVGQESDGQLSLSSVKLGLTVVIRASDGACIEATYLSPGKGTPVSWEVLDWHPGQVFPAPCPAIVRMVTIANGVVTPRQFLIDRVEHIDGFDSAVMDWRSYNSHAIDRVSGVRLGADGERQRDSAYVAPRDFGAFQPRSEESRRVRSKRGQGGQEPGDRRADASRTTLPTGRSVTWLWLVLGGLLVGFAGILAWRRRGV